MLVRITILFCLSYFSSAYAGDANVLNVDIRKEGNIRFTFNVTVQHPDMGWDHYADRWEILTMEGEILAVRTLRHPHIKEQPFIRSLPFVPVPEDINNVIIRAHCSVDGYTGKTIKVEIPR